MSHPLPRIVAFAPASGSGSGSGSAVAFAAAACRAGAMGVISPDRGANSDAPAGMERLTDRPFAIRVPRGEAIAPLLGAAPASLAAVVGTEDASTGWAGFAGEVARLGRVPIAEVTSRESALAAIASGVVALIASGHEAGGVGSELSTFILTQDLLQAAPDGVRIWARGGIGPRSAAGFVAMGAAGVVLDGAALLARESPLAPSDRDRVARLDGGETVVVGPAGGPRSRLLAPSGAPALRELRDSASRGGDEWDRAARAWIGWGPGRVPPVGQDAAFAKDLADRCVTVGGIVIETERAIDAGIAAAGTIRPLAEGSALAVSHGTRFPIVQGPMTRVSDSAAFARAVADGGALPMLALAMLRGPEVRALLDASRPGLESKPWGVGLLGFIDSDLRREQIAAVVAARPPFALIAGGRPDQAAELEASGIATYLHAPSPGLLRQYLKDGARRFVFEGRECGGHVGPRSSPVLWEQALGVIAEAIDGGLPAGEIHALFAGGIHDRRSSAFVAAMTAPLAARGVKVGVLMGTAYLFTREAVASRAIVGRFQDEARKCRSTVLLETGPGHEVRVGISPFTGVFENVRQRLAAEGKPAHAIREELERLNVGRLRVASKGVDRPADSGSPLLPVPDADQFDRGLYMWGQAAVLRDDVTTIAALHRDVCGRRDSKPAHAAETRSAVPQASPSDVAIVGLSAIFPGAADARTFWENTLNGRDAIREIPPDRWDWRPYYDPDPKAPDKIVSKWGGFLPDVPFDPLRYGMPPNSLASIEPVQLLTLEAVRSALADAGYADRTFPRERTAVVMGIGGGAAQLAMGYAFRAYLPMLDAAKPGAGREAMDACAGLLPEWTEDAFPGFLLNVAAGRVANRFDLGGANYVVDAACGSSLAAANLAIRELEAGAADMVILGGADTVQNPLTYLAFSKTQAFSPRGRCRPFDASADGIVISEGVSAIVLKRLADAERDGDRIYAVIKGMGSSSDGRARGLTAPRPEGQTLALKRAYARAGIDPATVGYVEAHGTGTAVGDVVEVQALAEVLRDAGAGPGSCAVGSVKSSIGHTKCAAGMAGLINAALALHHKVLPPTIGVEAPNPRAGFAGSPLHISADRRPWLHDEEDRPRRAGVSAFGFGGTNFHAVLEAYEGNLVAKEAPLRDWPCELFAWSAEDREAMLGMLDRLAGGLDGGAAPPLRDLAQAVLSAFPETARGPVLAIVADSLADLRSKLETARGAIRGGTSATDDPRGIHYAAEPSFRGSPVAFLFPGQGAQRPGMLGELAIAFDPVRVAFEEFDAALRALGRPAVGARVFPPPAFSDEERSNRIDALRSPEVAQPAVGAASVGLFHLLGELGLKPDMAGGHSYGEFVALHAAGALPTAALAEVSEARGRFLLEAIGDEPGTMAALPVGPERAREVINGWTDVLPVNFNGPGQTVIAGPRASVALAVKSARDLGHGARELSVACAFHTPMVAGASAPVANLLGDRLLGSPTIPVYSNLDAAPHPSDPSEIARRMGRHLASPVKFAAMIERMHADGARVFVECGPGGILAPLVGSILGDRPHRAIALDSPRREGIPALLHGVALLVAAGVTMRLSRLTEGRSDRRLDLDALPPGDGPPLPSSTWMVNGSRSRPIDAPEPRRLGQVLPPAPAPSPSPVAPTPVVASSPPRPRPAVVVPPPAKPSTPRAIPASLDNAAAPGDRVMLAFQETMRRFLDVQTATMGAYLASRSGASTPSTARPPIRETFPREETSPPPIPIRAETPPAPIVSILKPEPEPEPIPAATHPAPARDKGPGTIAEALVAIVRDRTGYPAEMLRPDLDLEADLGIDSIKRVEILGSLRDAYREAAGKMGAPDMDDLARAKTLGAIAERFAKVLAKGTPSPFVPEPAPERSAEATVRRMRLEAVPAEIEGRAGLVPGGVVLLTDDGRGVARAAAAEFEDEGHPAIVIDPAEVDLASESAIDRFVDEARARGPIAGIVHALPLRHVPPSGADPSAWSNRVVHELKSLFLLSRSTARDLERSVNVVGAGDGFLIAATGLGGAFGSVGIPPGNFPANHGGVIGLVKTLAREWPTVRVRAVDFDPGDGTEAMADRLVSEAFAADPRSEVGYRDGRRLALMTREAPLTNVGDGLDPTGGGPVVLTGGARGITAAVALEMAKRWRPLLLIVGTMPSPEFAESPDTNGLTEPSRIKSTLLGRPGKGGFSSPSALESAYRDLLKAREIRANLEALRRAGAVVSYGAADVRDPQALGRLLDGWREQYGPPTGIIHGAGVIHDKLLKDKTPESFDRVFGTKVFGALNLLNAIDQDKLRFAAMFSSIAGRFGNRGQSDYAAANEALNKLAIWLDGEISGRVLSAIWGPWAGVGMVSDLEAHLGRQGLAMIPPIEGARRFADELALGQKGDVEVLLCGALGNLERPPGPRPKVRREEVAR